MTTNAESDVQLGLQALREIAETREGKIVNPNEAAALLAERERLRQTLADIAVSGDMTWALARAKALRVYQETATDE